MAKMLKIEIVDPVGLYAIPASELVATAKEYQSDIYVIYNNKKVNMKSVMGVLSLGIPKKAVITIEFDGYDENDAFKKIKQQIIEKGIGKAI